MYIFGQLCGIVGTVITIIQPQFRKKIQILICCILVNLLSALNYGLVAQTGSAVYLCMVAIVQSLVSIWHERRGTAVSTAESIGFFALYLGFGLFGMVMSEGFVWGLCWANVLELLPILGALMLMLSVFAKGEQRTRWFLLCNALIWAVYSAAIGATAFFIDVAAITSTGIALWKYRKQ